MKIKTLKELKTIGGKVVKPGTVYENEENNPPRFKSKEGFILFFGFGNGLEKWIEKGEIEVIPEL